MEETNRILNHIEQFLRETPEVESYSRRTGARLALAIAEPNTGDFLIKLRKKSSRSLDEVTAELRKKINSSEPAIQVEFPHILEDLVGDLAWSPDPIEIKLYNPNEAARQQATKDIEAWLPHVRGVVDVENETVTIGPSMNFRINPQQAALAGFAPRDVANLESAIVDGQLASNIVQGDQLIGLRVRYPLRYRTSFQDLQNQLITSPTGQIMKLSTIAHEELAPDQMEIRRENLRDLDAVKAHLDERDLGSAMKEIEERLPKEVHLPPDTEVEYGGLYQIQQESFALVDVTTQRKVRSIKLALGANCVLFDPERTVVYVTAGGDRVGQKTSTLETVDPVAGDVLKSVQMNALHLQPMALDQKTGRLFVNLADQNASGIYNRDTLARIATWRIPTGSRNSPIAFDSEHRRLFVMASKPGILLELNADSGEPRSSIPTPPDPDDMALDSATQRIFMPRKDDLAVYDVSMVGHIKLLQQVLTGKDARTGILFGSPAQYAVAVPSEGDRVARVLIFDVRQ